PHSTVTAWPAAMRQPQSAAPSPARCISSPTLTPRAIASSSAARICAAVRTSFRWVIALESHGKTITVVGDCHAEHVALDRQLRLVGPVGHGEPMPVGQHLEPAEPAVRMAHSKEPRPVDSGLFDHANALELLRSV